MPPSSAARPRSSRTWRCAKVQTLPSTRSSWTSSTSTAIPTAGGRGRCRCCTLPRAQFILMSATLGAVTALADDLSRRTGRETALITGVDRPVPLHFSYALTPVHETVEDLLHTGQSPIYIVHFSQARGARAGAGAVERQGHQPRAARRDRRGDRRLPLHDGLRPDAVATHPQRHRSAPRGHAAQVSPTRRDSSRSAVCCASSAAPTRSASESTCRFARC